MEEYQWSWDWLKEMQFEKTKGRKLIPYPLQFANCRRIEKNNAVYIFDEVGTGKTISAGLMAIHYLKNHPDRDVLVITHNSVVWQFGNSWINDLRFVELGLKDRFKVIGNTSAQVRDVRDRKNGEPFGLIILDEAHEWITSAEYKDRNGRYGPADRYSSLLNLRTQSCWDGAYWKSKEISDCVEKVVFLTATPIKQSLKDLDTYLEIAEKLLPEGTELDRSWIEDIRGISLEKTDVETAKKAALCSKFDPGFPAARYFKDTVQALTAKSYDENRNPRRLWPLLWKYGPEEYRDGCKNTLNIWRGSKYIALLEHLKGVLEKNADSHFIIFTNRVIKEATPLAKLLKPFAKSLPALFPGGEDDVRVVTGENRGDLARYQGKEPAERPRILILTWQIGERGLDLPCYNYVVNFHVPSDPAALEQRFGRIDRLGSDPHDIHMAFLLRHCCYDTSTANFYLALSRYQHGLLTCLPAKNIILTVDLLDDMRGVREHIRQMKRNFEELLYGEEKDAAFSACMEYCRKDEKEAEGPPADSPYADLVAFCMEHSIFWSDEYEDYREQFRKRVVDAFSKQLKELGPDGSIEEHKEFISKISTQIFFAPGRGHNNSLITMDPIKECARYIEESRGYQEFLTELNEKLGDAR